MASTTNGLPAAAAGGGGTPSTAAAAAAGASPTGRAGSGDLLGGTQDERAQAALKSLQTLVAEPGASVRCSANFLPKFNNQSDGERLAPGLEALGDRGCLLVSKKHSGSLLMAPPFYSKNGVANDFSRLGARVLLEYMCAAWGEPTDRPETFSRCSKPCGDPSACSQSAAEQLQPDDITIPARHGQP